MAGARLPDRSSGVAYSLPVRQVILRVVGTPEVGKSFSLGSVEPVTARSAGCPTCPPGGTPPRSDQVDEKAISHQLTMGDELGGAFGL